MLTLNSTLKGVITGAAIVLLLVFSYTNSDQLTRIPIVNYLVPVIYAIGIIWAVYSFYLQQSADLRFGKLFNEAFKCFVVVTLFVVLYFIVFYKLHPEIIEQSARETEKYLLGHDKNRTPAEIHKMAEDGKKNFIVMAASITLLQYLAVGAIISAVVIGFIIFINKNKNR